MKPSFYIFKLLDRTLGRLATIFIPHRLQLASLPERLDTILFIRPGGIGDAVLLAPAVSALKKNFPRASLTVLAEKRNSGIFSLVPGIERVLRYDVPREFGRVFRLKPDLVIDTEQYHRLSAVVARLTGASLLIGFGTNERARLFHHPVSYSHEDYEAESFFRLLKPLGIDPSASLAPPSLSVPPAVEERATHLLAPLGGRPFVTLFPGASIPERRWGDERFVQVASSLARRGCGVVVVGGPDDAYAGEKIISAAAGLNLAGRTTLAETAAILRRSALLISGDSGVLHIGVGLGAPTVSLFGPGIAKKWAPRGPQHIVIDKNLPCSPCTKFGYTPKCPMKAECLSKIGVDEVVCAAMTLLQ